MYKDILNKLIKKPYKFKDGKELKLTLKAILTKKEFKALDDLDNIESKVLEKIVKKLNNEKNKQKLEDR